MGLMVGEVVQKILGHQVDVVDTLGEAVVLIITKSEVEEEARIAVGKAVQVYLVGTYVITALCKLMNGWAEFKILIDFHIRFSFTYSLYSSSHSNNWGS